MYVCVIPEAEAAVEVLPPGLGVVLPGAVGAAGERSKYAQNTLQTASAAKQIETLVDILPARFSCSVASSVKCYFTIYLHGESLSEQLINATIQLKVHSKLHQRQQRLKHLHRLPNAITTLVILNPLLRGY